MNGNRIPTGDTLYYEDSLQRLVELKVLSIPQDNTYIGTVDPGKTGIKVDCNIPKGVGSFINVLRWDRK